MSNATASGGSGALFCDDFIFMAGCPEGMTSFQVAMVFPSLFAMLNIIRVVSQFKPLLKGMKWAKMNPPQTMCMGLVFGMFFLLAGVALRSAWWYAADDPEAEPPIAIQIVVPILMYALGGPIITHTLLIYVIFWLQILDVKRTTYQSEYNAKKLEASEKGLPEPPPPRPLKKLSESKIKEMGLLVLSLAKSRPKLMKLFNRMTASQMSVNVVLILVAAFLEPQSDIRAVVLSVIWFSTSTTWLTVIYFNYFYGHPLIILYGRKAIMSTWQVNFSIFILEYSFFLCMTVAELPGVPKDFRNTMIQAAWGSTMALLIVAPTIMGQLMRIPLAAMKKKMQKDKARSESQKLASKDSSLSSSRRFSAILKNGINIERTRAGSVVSPTTTSPEDASETSAA